MPINLVRKPNAKTPLGMLNRWNGNSSWVNRHKDMYWTEFSRRPTYYLWRWIFG